MPERKRTMLFVLGCGTGFVAAWSLAQTSAPHAPAPEGLRTTIVAWEDAVPHRGDWGEMRFYFRGQTRGTRDVLVATAVVEPGKAVHRSHRHAEEEYLFIQEGTGVWFVDGKETPARKGDCLFVEPWVYHGLTNTSDRPLVFTVVRFNPKGVDLPPRPDDRKDEL